MPWYLWVVVILVTMFGPPLYLKLVTRADVTTDLMLGAANGRNLFVHLAGYVGDGYTQIKNIEQSFLSKGDLLTVHYEGNLGRRARRFDEALVLRETKLAIGRAMSARHYEHVVFIGTSMGGKLSYRVARFFAALKENKQLDISLKAVLIDPPLSGKDLQFGLRILSYILRYVLYYLPVVNFLLFIFKPLEHLVISKLVLPGPKQEEISDKLTAGELAELEDSVVWAQHSRLSFMRDQVGTILKRVEPGLTPWGRHDVVVFRSKEDNETVRESARDSWTELLGFEPHRLTIREAKHCAYGQQAPLYRPAFKQGFELIGVS